MSDPTPEQLLMKLREGGKIVSSGDLSTVAIATARACGRMTVDDDGFGYVYQSGKSDINTADDPICGACLRRRSNHYAEDGQLFCNKITNGDVFTTEPADDSLMGWIRLRHPEFVRVVTEDWKAQHGHRP